MPLVMVGSSSYYGQLPPSSSNVKGNSSGRSACCVCPPCLGRRAGEAGGGGCPTRDRMFGIVGTGGRVAVCILMQKGFDMLGIIGSSATGRGEGSEGGPGRAARLNVTKSDIIKWKVRNVAPATRVCVSPGPCAPAKGNQELGGARTAEEEEEVGDRGEVEPALALTNGPPSPNECRMLTLPSGRDPNPRRQC